MKQMKTLTMPNGVTYEIVDDKARKDLFSLESETRRDCMAPITQTASGNSIAIDDSSDRPIRNLRLFGKSKQAITIGRQLFDANTAETFDTKATFTVDNDVITYSANEPYMVSRLRVSHELLVPGKTYILECDAISEGLLCQFIANDVVASQSIVDARLHGSTKRVEFTIPASVDLSVFETFDQYSAYMAMSFFFTTDAHINRELAVTGLRLYAADNPLTVWEPFSGGIAGPNPEYPLEIESVDNPTISVYGGNIFNAHELTVGVNKTLDVHENGYLINVSGGGDKGYTSSTTELDVSVLRGRTVTIAADAIYCLNQNAKAGAQLNIKYPTWTEYIAISQSSLSKTVRIGDDVVSVHATVYTNNTASALTTDNAVTIYGMRISVNADSGWCEYKECKSATLPRTLSGIPVESGGNYTDANGQQWICDEVDFERKVYIQRIYTVTVTLDSIVRIDKTYASTTGSIASFLPKYPPATIDTTCTVMSDLALGVAYSDHDKYCDIYRCYAGKIHPNFIFLHYPVSKGQAVSESKFAGATVSYVLATPIETPLTDEELAAFDTLYTHKPNTTVLNDQGADMEMEYSADLEKFIMNNNSAPSDEQVSQAVVSYLEKNPLHSATASIENGILKIV